MKAIIAEPNCKEEKRNYVVYVHTFPNGKKYVGISRDVRRRFRNGRGYEHQRVVYYAIQKYGWSSVKTQILETNLTAEEAKAKEIELIAKWKTADRDFGYNQTLGGEGGNGRRNSEEINRAFGVRMAQIHKGVPLTEEHKKKIANTLAHRTPNISDAGRQKIIESNRNRVYTEEIRSNVSAGTKAAMQAKNVGKHLSDVWERGRAGRVESMALSNYSRYGAEPRGISIAEKAKNLLSDEERKEGIVYVRDPIYVPKGPAKEYGDYALNIYNGCPHNCYYCYAPKVMHVGKEIFHGRASVRTGLIEATKKQLESQKISGRTIFLSFIGDPFPRRADNTPTLEIIRLLKEYGNHVQILTKGDGRAALPLLDENDWFGVTVSCMGRLAESAEPGALPPEGRLWQLVDAKHEGIKTWVSFEPVLCPDDVMNVIRVYHNFIDKAKIGKLNYHPSDIDWKQFGHDVEKLCTDLGMDFYIKDSLRAEMLK